MEAVLNAPQALKKMPITTNKKEERKGSDGVHIRWNEGEQALEIFFAESKIWADFGKALADAFQSMDEFHNDGKKDDELKLVSAQFKIIDADLQGRVLQYIDGDDVLKTRITHVCLIGFNWSEYACLDDSRRNQFVADFEQRYAKWAASAVQKLENKVNAFQHKFVRFEVFFLPFKSVDDFRKWFEEGLRG
jgi:hypothetical protein